MKLIEFGELMRAPVAEKMRLMLPEFQKTSEGALITYWLEPEENL